MGSPTNYFYLRKASAPTKQKRAKRAETRLGKQCALPSKWLKEIKAIQINWKTADRAMISLCCFPRGCSLVIASLQTKAFLLSELLLLLELFTFNDND